MSPWNELRTATRALARAPRFTLLVTGVLAVGIGASTAIWTTVRAVLLDQPPVVAPDELLVVERSLVLSDGGRGTSTHLSYPMFGVLRDTLAGRAAVAAYTADPRPYNLSIGTHTERLAVEFVSGDYLDVLGVGRAAGRSLQTLDDREGAAPVVVLSHATARALFGSVERAVGAPLSIDGHRFEVVGVTPAGFAGLSRRAAAFVPMAAAPRLTFARRLTGTLSSWHQAVLRPAPDLGAEELTGLLQRAAVLSTERFAGGDVTAIEYARMDLRAARGDAANARAVLVAFGGVLALLLLACANVANLLLVRGAGRGRELAVRLAIGASPGRLVRGALLEGLLLGAAATAVAVPLASGALAGLGWAAPGLALAGLPVEALALDSGALLFAAACALACVLLAMLGPALSAARAARRSAVAVALRGPAALGGLRRGLVACEAGLAMVLLVLAGLMLRSAWNLQGVDPGYRATDVTQAQIAMPSARFRGPTADAFLGRALDAVRAIPGVESAALAYCPPPLAACDQIVAERQGADGPDLPVVLNQVSAGYFTTLGIPLLRGRAFGPGDGADGAPVVVLSEQAAAQLFGDAGRALGERLQLGVGWPADGAWAEVVGVVGDVRDAGVAQPPRALLYTDLRQLSYGEATVLVRGAPGLPMAEDLRTTVSRLDPEVVAWGAAPLVERQRGALARERLLAGLLGAFAALALLLATSGVYAVLALTVEQRTREFAVRLAVGARATDLAHRVVREGVGAVLVGALVGLSLAQVGSQALGALLFGVAPHDPWVPGSALVALLLAAAAGAAVPAHRAAQVQPMQALRHE